MTTWLFERWFSESILQKKSEVAGLWFGDGNKHFARCGFQRASAFTFHANFMQCRRPAAASAALAVCFRKTKHIIRTCFITISFGMSTVLAADGCVVARSRIGKPQPFSGHFDGSLHLTREISYLSTPFKVSVEVIDRTRRYVSENYEGLGFRLPKQWEIYLCGCVKRHSILVARLIAFFRLIWQVSFPLHNTR